MMDSGRWLRRCARPCVRPCPGRSLPRVGQVPRRVAPPAQTGSGVQFQKVDSPTPRNSAPSRALTKPSAFMLLLLIKNPPCLACGGLYRGYLRIAQTRNALRSAQWDNDTSASAARLVAPLRPFLHKCAPSFQGIAPAVCTFRFVTHRMGKGRLDNVPRVCGAVPCPVPEG